MKRILLSMRVIEDSATGERRDCLDQRWTSFLTVCDLLPLQAPNNPAAVERLLPALQPEGILLTGGGDLNAYGGNTPERDTTEGLLFDYAQTEGISLLGVCRGFQFILHRFGGRCETVTGHVACEHGVDREGERGRVNSFHDLGLREAPDPLVVWAQADDGVIEGVRHPAKPLAAIMWHPERSNPHDQRDISFFRSFFGVD